MDVDRDTQFIKTSQHPQLELASDVNINLHWTVQSSIIKLLVTIFFCMFIKHAQPFHDNIMWFWHVSRAGQCHLPLHKIANTTTFIMCWQGLQTPFPHRSSSNKLSCFQIQFLRRKKLLYQNRSNLLRLYYTEEAAQQLMPNSIQFLTLQRA